MPDHPGPDHPVLGPLWVSLELQLTRTHLEYTLVSCSHGWLILPGVTLCKPVLLAVHTVELIVPKVS